MRAALGLLAAATALAGVIAGEWVLRPRELQAPEVAAPPVSVRAGPDERPRDQDGWVGQILARPLFAPDRRPVAEKADGGPGLPRLSGIVVDGARRIAIFVDPATPNPVTVVAGQAVAGWEIRDISTGGVTVSGPWGTKLLRPDFDPHPPPPRQETLPEGPPALLQLEAKKPHG